MSSNSFTVTIYGARGSLPNSCEETQKYGGATTCMSVERQGEDIIVLDAGTGIVDLGQTLAGDSSSSRQIHLFFTHTHWDHVMGLPSFAPLLEASNTIHIYGLAPNSDDLKDKFSTVFDPRHFPVPRHGLPANLVYHALDFEDTVTIGSTTVQSCRVNHPGYALAFRITSAGKSIFFACDFAPYSDVLFENKYHERRRTTDPDMLKTMGQLENAFRRTADGSDIMFLDANFTDKQYESFYHWGHSSMRLAFAMAQVCNTSHLVLWHHERGRGDERLEELAAAVIADGKNAGITVELAQAGKQYDL